jgi:hypothetical protein
MTGWKAANSYLTSSPHCVVTVVRFRCFNHSHIGSQEYASYSHSCSIANTIRSYVMNAMLKITLTAIVVASIAATSYADSKRPWTHTSDDFWASNQPTARTYYYAPRVASQPQVVERRAYSFEPAPAFKAGDMVVVNKATSELKIGNRVIANLPKGTRFAVVAVQSGWIGANVEHNGQKVSGWLLGGDLAADAANAPTSGR